MELRDAEFAFNHTSRHRARNLRLLEDFGVLGGQHSMPVGTTMPSA